MDLNRRMYIIYFGIFLLIDIAANQKLNQNGKRQKRDVITATVLTEEEKQHALFLHNTARSNAQPSCNNMLKMMWDEGLAQTAQTYSRECIYEHSSGLKTDTFDDLGENLYVTRPVVTPSEFLKYGIEHWDNEKLDYNFTANTCSGVCGHYTQVVWDDTYAVGCGMTTCKDLVVSDKTWPVGQLLVCHYAPSGNINNRRPYVRGTPCSVCPRNYWCENRLCNKASSIEGFFTMFYLTLLVICVNLLNSL